MMTPVGFSFPEIFINAGPPLTTTIVPQASHLMRGTSHILLVGTSVLSKFFHLDASCVFTSGRIWLLANTSGV